LSYLDVVLSRCYVIHVGGCILKELLVLLCTLPGQRPGTAKGGERARPGRVLVRYVHFFLHI